MIYKLLLIGLLLSGCRTADKEGATLLAQLPEPRETLGADTTPIPVYDFEGLEPLLHRDDGATYVVNFWATWCAPCIKELPYFEQVRDDFRNEGVQVILVSLDMPRMWDSKLLPFVRERNLRSQVVVLDDPRQNDWIPKVDASWSGAIPATLIYSGDKRVFYEEAFTYERLKDVLTNF